MLTTTELARSGPERREDRMVAEGGPALTARAEPSRAARRATVPDRYLRAVGVWQVARFGRVIGDLAMAACERGNASEPSTRGGRFGLPARALRPSAGRTAAGGGCAARSERQVGERSPGDAPERARLGERSHGREDARRCRSRRPEGARGRARGRPGRGRPASATRCSRLLSRRSRGTARSSAGGWCLAAAVARRLAATARDLAEERERARGLPGRPSGTGDLLPALSPPSPVPSLGQST